MTLSSFRFPLLLSLTLLTLGARAHAQGDANSRALAVQLFDEAEALIAKERVAEACPKYAESYRLDPQLGALIYLAECYEKNGQLASAWGSFREADEMARKRGDQRGDSARARASALEPRLSRFVVQVEPSARVPGLVVTRDGAVVAPVLWGTAAAIDRGKHHFVASAPGYESWQGELSITTEAATETLTIPTLKAASPTLAPGAAPRPIGATDTASTSSRRPTSFLRTTGWVTLATGGVGIGIGAVAGFLALQKKQTLDDSDACNSDYGCQASQGSTVVSYNEMRKVSSVGLIAGGALAAAGLTLVLVAPSDRREVTVQVTPGTVRMAGKF